MTAPGGSAFKAKVNGVPQTLYLNDGAITDAAGNNVTGQQIEYPTWHPTIGLTDLQNEALAARTALFTHAEVTRDELGDVEPTPALPVTYGDEDEPQDEISDLTASIEARMGAKTFSAAEKDQIINEGTGGARNLTDALDLTGTHYQGIEAPDDTEWGFI